MCTMWITPAWRMRWWSSAGDVPGNWFRIRDSLSPITIAGMDRSSGTVQLKMITWLMVSGQETGKRSWLVPDWPWVFWNIWRMWPQRFWRAPISWPRKMPDLKRFWKTAPSLKGRLPAEESSGPRSGLSFMATNISFTSTKSILMWGWWGLLPLPSENSGATPTIGYGPATRVTFHSSGYTPARTTSLPLILKGMFPSNPKNFFPSPWRVSNTATLPWYSAIPAAPHAFLRLKQWIWL